MRPRTSATHPPWAGPRQAAHSVRRRSDEWFGERMHVAGVNVGTAPLQHETVRAKSATDFEDAFAGDA